METPGLFAVNRMTRHLMAQFYYSISARKRGRLPLDIQTVDE